MSTRQAWYKSLGHRGGRVLILPSALQSRALRPSRLKVRRDKLKMEPVRDGHDKRKEKKSLP